MTERPSPPIAFRPSSPSAALRLIHPLASSLPTAPSRMAIAFEEGELARSDPLIAAAGSLWLNPLQAWGARSSPSLSGSAWFAPAEAIHSLWSAALAPFPPPLAPQIDAPSGAERQRHASSASFEALALARTPWLILSLFELPCGQSLLTAHQSPSHFSPCSPRHPFALADARFTRLCSQSGMARTGFGDAGFMGRARLDAHLALLAANELAALFPGGPWRHPERSASFRALASFHRAFGYPGPLEAEGPFFNHRFQDALRAWRLAAALSERSALRDLSESFPAAPGPGARL